MYHDKSLLKTFKMGPLSFASVTFGVSVQVEGAGHRTQRTLRERAVAGVQRGYFGRDKRGVTDGRGQARE